MRVWAYQSYQRMLLLVLLALLVALAWALSASMPLPMAMPAAMSSMAMPIGTMDGGSMAMDSPTMTSPRLEHPASGGTGSETGPSPSCDLATCLPLGMAGQFVFAWLVMTAAMMLPSSLPMVDAFGRLVRARSDGGIRVMLFVLGYLAVWGGFGVLAYLSSVLADTAVRQSTLLTQHRALLSGGVLLLVGVYQFSPQKHLCLSKCRSPLSFLMSHWKEGRLGALILGSRHGAFCVGCCWALMLLMLGVATAQLVWMAGLALVMFAEKVTRPGELVGHAVGLGLLVGGLAVAAGVVG